MLYCNFEAALCQFECLLTNLSIMEICVFQVSQERERLKIEQASLKATHSHEVTNLKLKYDQHLELERYVTFGGREGGEGRGGEGRGGEGRGGEGVRTLGCREGRRV